MGSSVTTRDNYSDAGQSKLSVGRRDEWEVCPRDPTLAAGRTSIRLVFAAAMYACPVALSEEPQDRLNTVAVGGVDIDKRASVHSHTPAASV